MMMINIVSRHAMMFASLIVLSLAVIFPSSIILSVSAQSCLPTATSDPSPSPVAAGAYLNSFIGSGAANISLANFVTPGCSEKASIYSMTRPYTGPDYNNSGIAAAIAPNIASWSRTSCPHLASNLVPFESVFTGLVSGATITIATGSFLLIRACSLPAASQTDPTWMLYRITIAAGASLVFDDSAMTLRAREIVVQTGGTLSIGSPSCRLYSSINIVLHGSMATSAIATDKTSGLPTKGILASGNIDIHGKLYHPTWTRLSRSAGGSIDQSRVIFLQEGVNWDVGQQVLITTTILLDCGASYENPWCVPCYNKAQAGCTPTHHQNEVKTIVSMGQSPAGATGPGTYTALVLDSPLTFVHYGGVEYQAEVALLSRKIMISGDSLSSADNFGGHIQVIGPNSQGRFSGIKADLMGQTNQLGRYPFHFHMMGDSVGSSNSYVQDCSVTNSFFRGYTIHGTNHTRLSRNVAFNITGMVFYLEDGVEENNLLEYNLAAHIHPIMTPANGGYGQGGETFLSQPGLLIPADVSASGFYILNAMNSFIGNAVSGGWSGFAFPNAPGPMGAYNGLLNADSNYNPMARPLQRFVGNSAHSAGYHWSDEAIDIREEPKVEHGSCFYFGAWLNYNNGTMQYNSGRNNRISKYANGTGAVMLLEHTKAFLCNKGIAHWGNSVTIQTAELIDTRVGAMMFGSAALINVIVNGRTPNLQSTWVISDANRKIAFQFYDTWVQTILSGVTFRNYHAPNGEYAIRYLDFSDHYTPQGINAVRGITYSNVDAASTVGISNCGVNCPTTSSVGTTPGTYKSSMSNRIYSVWDTDGSMSGSSVPSILGSHESWWNNSPEQNCVYKSSIAVWVCDWLKGSSVGFIAPAVPITGLSGGCDYARWSNCTDQFAFYTVGKITQWGGAIGAARTINLSPWQGIAGYANTGWYWRMKAPEYNIDGAPSSFIVDETMQLTAGAFVVLAIAYPAAATFSIIIQSTWWKDSNQVYYTYPVAASSYAAVTNPVEAINPSSTFTCTGTWWSMCTNTGGVGPAYYFDAAAGFLYLRVVSPSCYNNNRRTVCESSFGNYLAGNINVPNTNTGFKYIITATCPGCAVQSTYGGVTFWSAPDAPPASRFPTAYGGYRAPSTAPAPEAAFVPYNQCSPAMRTALGLDANAPAAVVSAGTRTITMQVWMTMAMTIVAIIATMTMMR